MQHHVQLFYQHHFMVSERLNGQARATQHIHGIIQAVDSKPQLLPPPSLRVSLGSKASDAVGSTGRSLFSGAQLWVSPASCQQGLLYSALLIALVELAVKVV